MDNFRKDPFRTTRTMSVPFHSRRGHRERLTEKIVKIVLYSSATIMTIVWLITDFWPRLQVALGLH